MKSLTRSEQIEAAAWALMQVIDNPGKSRAQLEAAKLDLEAALDALPADAEPVPTVWISDMATYSLHEDGARAMGTWSSTKYRDFTTPLYASAPSPDRTQGQEQVTQYGWLIERPHHSGRPIYFALPINVMDSQKALRFSRQEDAELFLKWMIGANYAALEDGYSVVEHGWHGRAAHVAAQTAEQQGDRGQMTELEKYGIQSLASISRALGLDPEADLDDMLTAIQFGVGFDAAPVAAQADALEEPTRLSDTERGQVNRIIASAYEPDALAALKEIVACEDLKKSIAYRSYKGTTDMDRLMDDQLELKSRQPLAWAEARRVIAATSSEGGEG